LDEAGNLEARERPLGMREHRLRRELAAGPGDEHDLDLLLGQFGRDADGGALEHVGMQQDALLDLERRDVLAAAADRVLAPADEEDVAVLVDPGGVTRVKPEVAKGL